MNKGILNNQKIGNAITNIDILISIDAYLFRLFLEDHLFCHFIGDSSIAT